MSLHIGDYLKDTRHLRAPEHGAYLLLIMHYWTTGGLPDDDRQLASIACMSDKEWKKARPTVMAFFRDGLRHKRIDQELAEAQVKYDKKVAAGRAGGLAKAKQNPSSARAKPVAKPCQPITLTPTDEEGGGEGSARESAISPEAFAFADRLLDAWGVDREDPRAISTAYTAQRWLSGGWSADLCVTTIRSVVARQKAPDSLKYFEKPIARAHAEHAAPVPVAEIAPQATVKAHAAPVENSFASALARLGSTAASLRASAGSGGGEDAPRLLSDGRGERS